MKRLALSLLLLASASIAQAGMVLVQELDQSGGPMAGKKQMTISISGDEARIDIDKEISTIVDSKSGSITTLMHKQKLAMELPEGTFNSIQKSASEQKEKTKPDLKPTGKKETINGFACEEYAGKVDGFDVSFWVTKDIANQKEILDQLGKLSGGSDPFRGALANGEDFPGFPIRSVIKTPQAGTSTMTVVSIKDEDVPASTFETPKGYKTMDMPKLQKPGNGAPAIPANSGTR